MTKEQERRARRAAAVVAGALRRPEAPLPSRDSASTREDRSDGLRRWHGDKAEVSVDIDDQP
jgi:hypothetical protein